MSRWDALKPDTEEEKSKCTYTRRRPKDGGTAGGRPEAWGLLLQTLSNESEELLVDAEQIVEEAHTLCCSSLSLPRVPSAGRILVLLLEKVTLTVRLVELVQLFVARNVLLDTKQLNQCIEALSVSTDPELRAQSICYFVKAHAARLPAERTSADVVKAVFLPAILNGSPETKGLVFEALSELLCEGQHATAILLPMTVEVSVEGVEKGTANPIGASLIACLETSLTVSCSTFVALLEAMKKMETTVFLQVRFAVLETFLVENLDNVDSLRLLRSLLLTYSDAAVKLKRLFLGELSYRRAGCTDRCPICGYQRRSVLIDLVHNDGGHRALVADCIRLYIDILPFDQWLNGDSTGSMHMFSRSVIDAMECLLRAVKCTFSGGDEGCKFIGAVLSRESCTNPKELVNHTNDLWSLLAREIMNDPLHTPARAVMVRCLGGHPRPQGGHTPFVISLQRWLSDAASQQFRNYLWDSIVQAKPDSPNWRPAFEILGSLLRMEPGVVLNKRNQWQVFKHAMEKQSTAQETRAEVATLLIKLFKGKADFPAAFTVTVQEIGPFVSLILQEIRKDQRTKLQVAALELCSTFLATDWHWVFNNGDGPTHLESIATKCRGGSANERSAACKALGNLCCGYLREAEGQDLSPVQETFQASVEVLQDCLDHKNSVVRSMALFSIGNMSQALAERKSKVAFLTEDQLSSLCDRVLSRMTDSNEKVVGNATRTLGHVGLLVLRAEENVSASWQTLCFCRIVDSLNAKIGEAIRASNAKLTWKQRSSAKKHGWGACNSLSLVLPSAVATSGTETLVAAREAYRSLAACIMQSDTMNEKVVLSAANAICAVPKAAMVEVSHRAGLTGPVLGHCLVRVASRNRRPPSRVVDALTKLMGCLLGFTTISDAYELLRLPSVDSHHLEFLYQWMMDENVDSLPFESFAVALQSQPSLLADVSIEQKFTSRALAKLKEERKSGSASDPVGNGDGDEDEEEI